MRSSFYSNVNASSEIEELKESKIVESFKLSNVVELKPEEKEILEEIKKTINEECDRLNLDIEELQFKLLNKPPT